MFLTPFVIIPRSLPAPNDNAYVPDVNRSLMAGSPLAFCSHQVQLQPAVKHGENTYRLRLRSMAHVLTPVVHIPRYRHLTPSHRFLLLIHPTHPTHPTHLQDHPQAVQPPMMIQMPYPQAPIPRLLHGWRQKRALARIRERQDLLESQMSWQFQRVNDHLARTHSTNIAQTSRLPTHLTCPFLHRFSNILSPGAQAHK